jgi:two-component system, cell cycle sensor histidine kinase and response regulator CckA
MRLTATAPRLIVKQLFFNWLCLKTHVVSKANRVTSRAMDRISAYNNREGRAPLATSSPAWSAWAGVAAATLAFAGLTAVTGPDAIGLATLVLLATTGLFFVFGVLAGYVQLDAGGARGRMGEVVADHTVATEIAADDGSILFCNRSAALLRGPALGSLEAALSAMPGASDAAYRLARAASRHEAHSEVVATPAALDGTVKWLHVQVEPFQAPVLISDARRLVRWSATDISAQRQTELSLRAAVAARDAFLDKLPVGVARVGANGIVTDMNTEMRRILRSDSDRAVYLSDLLANGGADLVVAARKRSADPANALSNGAAKAHVLDLVREDGTVAPARLLLDVGAGHTNEQTIVAIEESGRTAGATSNDDRIQRLLNGAPFGIATIDQDGCVINANSAFQRMFPEVDGSSRSIVRRLTATASADQRKAVETALVRALSGRATASAIEVVAGDAQTARSLLINPLTDGLDPRETAVIFVADATEHKALELKFAQSQRMEAVGKLAGGIAHDFNNVLTVIIGLADLLLQTRRPTDSGYQDLIQIRDNGRRAANMVKQLLAFSRKQTLEPEVIAVNELLQDFAFTFKKTIGEQIDVKYLPTRDLWTVKADRTQLDQVFLNLAVNAKDAMPSGGRLRLRSRNITERESLKFGGVGMLAGEYVLIEVEDNGSGMTPDVMAKIFEPFFTTKDVGKGTGLGLSTVYGIIKQTGGFIYPLSDVGRGTTFRVFLPRHVVTEADAAEAAAAADAKKKEQPRDLTGTGRVLLVEDEDGVRSFAVRALQRQGYEVIEAISGADALDVLAEADGKVDLIVSDVIMPEMDGPTMYTEMLKTYPGLKIIFMSGYPSDAFERTLDPKAEFAFLQKPVNLATLAAKVKEVISQP